MNKNLFLLLTIQVVSLCLKAQQYNMDSLNREAAKTEIYSPVPRVVTAEATHQKAPSDAIILFNGKDLSAWNGDDSTKPITWKVTDGILIVDNSHGYGGINTKQKFTDYQLHLEWREPADVMGEGQSRGNSGVNLAVFSYFPISGIYLERGYEIQILEDYNNNNKTYVNGQAGSLYKQSAPLVNACKKPGEWQTYDIFWKAPRFNNDGSLKTPAYVTVVQNGVMIQNNTEVQGETLWVGKPGYTMHGACPIRLQSHGDPGPTVSFRNIWIRTL